MARATMRSAASSAPGSSTRSSLSCAPGELPRGIEGRARGEGAVHGDQDGAELFRPRAVAAHGKHRDLALTEHALGHRPQHDAVHATAAVGAHHDEVRVAGLRRGDDGVHRKSLHDSQAGARAFGAERGFGERAKLGLRLADALAKLTFEFSGTGGGEIGRGQEWIGEQDGDARIGAPREGAGVAQAERRKRTEVYRGQNMAEHGCLRLMRYTSRGFGDQSFFTSVAADRVPDNATRAHQTLTRPRGLQVERG